MSGSSRSHLTISIFCICQVVIEVSTQPASAYRNNLSGSQDNITKHASQQHFDDRTAVDGTNVLNKSWDLGSNSENKQNPHDRQRQFLGHMNSHVTVGVPKLTPLRNRNTIIQDARVSNVSHLAEASTTARSPDITSHSQLIPLQSKTFEKPSLNMERVGLSETTWLSETTQSTEPDNTRNQEGSFNITFLQHRSIENNKTSSKSPYSNVSEVMLKSGNTKLSDMNAKFASETYVLVGDYKEQNRTVIRPSSVQSSQLSRTPNKDEADHKQAGYVKGTRTSDTGSKAGPSDHRPASRELADKTRQDNVSVSTQTETSVSQGTSTGFTETQTVTSVSQGTSTEFIETQTETSVSQETSTEFIETQTETSVSQETSTQFIETQTDENVERPPEDIDEEENNETSTCTTCSKSVLTEAQVKAIRLDMFKDLLAQKMRINLNDMHGAQNDGKPKTRPPKLPQYILEQTIKDNAEETEKDQFYARDQEIIIAGDDLGRDCPRSEVTGCFRFNLKDKVKLAVIETHLWFYKLKDVNDVRGQTFRVFQMHRNNSRYQQGRLISSKDGVTIKEGWTHVDVTGEVQKWLDTGRDTEELAIRCPTCKAKSYTSLFGVKQGYKPLLVMKYSTTNQATRGKRSLTCDPISECCKRELVVNFHEISMVEIYEPRNLSIGYCYGSCSEAHQITYNHTALKQRLRLTKYANQPTMSQQLMPCCVPLVLKDTFLMAIEGNECVRKIVPKIIVETCGCM